MKNSQSAYNPYDDLDDQIGTLYNTNYPGKSLDNMKSRSLANFPDMEQLMTKNNFMPKYK